MRLIAYRPLKDTYRSRSYRILFNGKTVGTLSPGQTVEIELLESGLVQFRIDSFTGSAKIKIEPDVDQHLSVSGHRMLHRMPLLLGGLLLFIAVRSIYEKSQYTMMIALIACGLFLLLISLFRNKWLAVSPTSLR